MPEIQINQKDIPQEQWVDIKDRVGYQINCNGVVRSIDRMIKRKDGFTYKAHGRILVQMDNGNGYLHVGFGKHYSGEYVHRLVAKTFIPNPNNYRCVNHKDLDKSNNYYRNLEWATHSQNNTHAKINGRGMVKISPEQVLEIRELKKIMPVKEIAAKYGLDYRYTFRVCNKRNWKTI